MIESLHFTNFRLLKDATLPLGRVTVLLGPNGSGKTTVLEALEAMGEWSSIDYDSVLSAGERGSAKAVIRVAAKMVDGNEIAYEWAKGSGGRSGDGLTGHVKMFSLEARKIAEPASLSEVTVPGSHGEGLAMVLTVLQDQHPERLEAINKDLLEWLPDFDRILFKTLQSKDGPQRQFMLRTTAGRHSITAGNLSEGTLLALAMLTIAHLPNPPRLIGFEEPDRGIHPRLLREVQDAIYRLAYPENFGDPRQPIQVILTTHSPYMVDLFSDHPEDIVICKKKGLYATFEPLMSQPHVEEIIRGTSLGEAWFSGILGGVPIES